jgi:phenylalanyl-tRNA synthetase beta chain
LDFSYVDNLIGKKIGHDVIKNILTSLEIEINNEDAEGLQITVPAYRVDVQRPCDVVEDILRIYGYNNVEIPTQLKSSLTTKAFEDQRHKMQNLVAEQLVGSGFNEILNNSLTKGAYYNELKAYPKENLVSIVNPLSSDLNVMRQTLLFGGLESIMRNANRKMPNLRFFEFGNCYQHFEDKRDDENPMKAYSEETHLGLWITGKKVEGSWAHANEDSSFYELKAHVENILKRIGMPEGMLVYEKSDNDIFSAGLTLKNRNGKVFVEMGIVSKKIQHKADIEREVYFADINWTLVTKAVKNGSVDFQEISKFPAVSRDLALLIDKSIEFAQIEQIARQSEKKLLKKVELFDVYEGKNLPEGKKSYAVNFILQDTEKTMGDKQIEAVMNKIISNLTKQLGAALR